MKAASASERRHAQALTRWAESGRTPDLIRHVRISYSRRLRKSLGRVRPKSGIITLNARLTSAPHAILLEVLCHEAAHVAVYLRHGWSAKPHGPEWRELIRLAGYQPTTRLLCSELSSQEKPGRVIPLRKHCRCPVCSTEYFVRRHNSSYHCSLCLRKGLTVKLEPMILA